MLPSRPTLLSTTVTVVTVPSLQRSPFPASLSVSRLSVRVLVFKFWLLLLAEDFRFEWAAKCREAVSSTAASASRDILPLWTPHCDSSSGTRRKMFPQEKETTTTTHLSRFKNKSKIMWTDDCPCVANTSVYVLVVKWINDELKGHWLGSKGTKERGKKCVQDGSCWKSQEQ